MTHGSNESPNAVAIENTSSQRRKQGGKKRATQRRDHSTNYEDTREATRQILVPLLFLRDQNRLREVRLVVFVFTPLIPEGVPEIELQEEIF